MNLDEAIAQCYQIIHNKTVEAETLKDGYEVFANDCLNDAEVHRQLAEWLQELKRLQENKGNLINRDMAIDVICEEIVSRFDVGITEGYELVEDALGGLPSAEPEIIRCKDCKYWNNGNCNCDDIRVDCSDYYVGDLVTEENFFCSFAGRREDE